VEPSLAYEVQDLVHVGASSNSVDALFSVGFISPVEDAARLCNPRETASKGIPDRSASWGTNPR